MSYGTLLFSPGLTEGQTARYSRHTLSFSGILIDEKVFNVTYHTERSSNCRSCLLDCAFQTACSSPFHRRTVIIHGPSTGVNGVIDRFLISNSLFLLKGK